MTRKTATRPWALFAALVVGAGWAMPASAQTAGTTAVTTAGTGATASGATPTEEGNITVSMVSAGGKPFPEQQRASKPINLQACIDGNMEVSVNAPGATGTYPYLEVWYSTGSGACNQGDRATRVTGTQNCTKLHHNKENNQLTGQQIFNTVVQIGPVCQLDSDQKHGLDGPKTLYFLLLQSQGSTETAMFYKAFTIKIDTTPPDAPMITSAGSGQTDIELKWNLPVTSTGFWVWADYSQGALKASNSDIDAGPIAMDGGTSAPAECSSNILKAGGTLLPDTTGERLFKHEITTPTTEWSFNGQDFGGVKVVPVVVAAEDLAGNVSPLSNVGCLKIEKTTGFWSRYKQGDAGGTADPGCACSVPGARTGRPSAVTAIPVALLLAGVLARRRIRRRAR